MKQKKENKGQKVSAGGVKRGRGRPPKNSSIKNVDNVLKKKTKKVGVDNIKKTFKVKEVNFNVVKPKSVEKGKMQIDTDQMLKDLAELGRIRPEESFQKVKIDKIHSSDSKLPKSPLAKLIEKRNASILKISAIFCAIVFCFIMSILYLMSSRTFIKIELNKIPQNNEFKRELDLFNENDDLRNNEVSAINLVVNTEATATYDVETKDVEGENSEGKIKIINNSNERKNFVRTTRFISDVTGSLYRLKSDTILPPNSITEAYVYADDKKVFKESAGTRFTIPGLKSDEAKKLIYGENPEAFVKGFAKKQVINEIDIVKSEEALSLSLRQKAVEELISKAMLFGDYEIILKSLSYSIKNKKSDGVIGKETDLINLSGNIDASAVFINKNKILTSVKNEILSQNTNGYFVDVDKNGAVFVVDRIDGLTKKLSLSISTNIKSSYDSEKILNKNDITGMKIDDFYKYVNDRGFAKDVEVSNYPFWNKKITSIVENLFISFK